MLRNIHSAFFIIGSGIVHDRENSSELLLKKYLTDGGQGRHVDDPHVAPILLFQHKASQLNKVAMEGILTERKLNAR